MIVSKNKTKKTVTYSFTDQQIIKKPNFCTQTKKSFY
jgi:hypothetical protein